MARKLNKRERGEVVAVRAMEIVSQLYLTHNTDMLIAIPGGKELLDAISEWDCSKQDFILLKRRLGVE